MSHKMNIFKNSFYSNSEGLSVMFVVGNCGIFKYVCIYYNKRNYVTLMCAQTFDLNIILVET